VRREQIIFNVALEAYDDIAAAGRILNRYAALSKRQRNECLKHVQAAFEKLGDIRELSLGRLSAKEYVKGVQK
jgi:hypothetical protein